MRSDHLDQGPGFPGLMRSIDRTVIGEVIEAVIQSVQVDLVINLTRTADPTESVRVIRGDRDVDG